MSLQTYSISNLARIKLGGLDREAELKTNDISAISKLPSVLCQYVLAVNPLVRAFHRLQNECLGIKYERRV